MIDVFCDVIDNYGDAGVCLRLCRDLTKKDISVNLYCNRTAVLSKILNLYDKKNELLKIYQWPDNKENYVAQKIIIQAFSVRLPSFLIENIKLQKSLVINLEYLTAETFAEECHQLPSFSDGIQSYFFFPGFTNKTGGVLIEDNYLNLIKKYRNHTSTSITVFSYKNDKLKSFIDNLNEFEFEKNLIIFEGKPLDNFNNIYKTNLLPDCSLKMNNLNILTKKMVSQDEYDELLCTSFINLVRGEDSIVRAMLAGKPFLWHIYPQEDNAHIEKINALFDRMNEYCDDKEAVEKLRQITLSYNGMSNLIDSFDLKEFYKDWKKISLQWSEHLISLGSLSSNLIAFLKQKT